MQIEDLKLWVCDLCGVVKSMKCQLSRHFNTVHLKFDSSDVYACDLCGMKYDNLSALRVHLREHVAKRLHKCPICLRSFDHKDVLDVHVGLHETFTCAICGWQFARKFLLVKHMRTHSENESAHRPYSCNKCGKTFSDISSLAVHRHRKHRGEEDIFSCSLCTKAFSNQSDLDEHMNFKHVAGRKPFNCQLCDKSFAQLLGLTSHLNRHFYCQHCGQAFEAQHAHVCTMTRFPFIGRNFERINAAQTEKSSTSQLLDNVEVGTELRLSDDISYTCQLCREPCNSKATLAEHLRSNHMRKLLRCPTCNKGFATPAHLAKHMRTHSEFDLSIFVCDVCGKSCKSSSSKSMHMRKHTGECPFSCDICGKAYRAMKPLRQHIRIHVTDEREKPFKCNQCNKTFSRKFRLQEHVATVHERKRVSCKVCGLALATPRGLKEHMRYHGDVVKPFSCTQCKASYLRQYHLNIHMRVHTGEKPHVCNFCGKSFAQMAGVRSHVKFIHTKERLHQCSICSKTFVNAASVRRHEDRVHAANREHKCELCDMAYSSRSTLQNHVSLHRASRFICDICTYPATSKGDLLSHLRAHTT